MELIQKFGIRKQIHIFSIIMIVTDAEAGKLANKKELCEI